MSAPLLRRRLRLGLVLICTVLVSVVCIRFAFVSAEADRTPGIASQLWGDEPRLLRAEIMDGVARAAKEGTSISGVTERKIALLSIRAPLDPAPFAVEGAIALRQGRTAGAEQLLIQARRRDPRDRGVRFLLADLYLRRNEAVPGLQELVTLARLSPDATASVADMLASYAHSAGALPQLRQALRLSPQIQDALLSKLSADAANADLVLALAAPIHSAADLPSWEKRLLSSLLEAGEFKRAMALWQRFSGRTESEPGDFADSKVSSPFTWTLLTSSDGSATARGRELAIEFFGRADTPLASRVIMLAPGQYDLGFQTADISGDPAGLHWIVTCLPGGRELLNVSLSKAAGALSLPFVVPADCPAQRIALNGLAAVYPSEIDLSISGLEVRKRG